MMCCIAVGNSEWEAWALKSCGCSFFGQGHPVSAMQLGGGFTPSVELRMTRLEKSRWNQRSVG